MRSRWRRSLATMLVACATALSLPMSTHAAAAPFGQVACRHAVIEGESKCIARGQFCKRTAAARRDYRRYGLSCTKRDSRGRYHLQ